MIVSSIKNFRYVIKNIGWTGQIAAVSFSLGINIRRDGKEIFTDNIEVTDFQPGDAEYFAAEDSILGPILAAHMSKADKLAVSAFIGTSKILCDKYRNALVSVQ